MTEKSHLLELASAVVEGSAIDWDEIERQPLDIGDRPIVRELKLLADIAAVARNPSSQDTGPAAGEASDPSATNPSTWGQLRLLNQIGRGTFGTIYRAWDSRLERDVALKLMHASVEPSSFDVSRALREARLLARVNHPHVVTVFGADCHDGRFGLWMELVNGLALDELVAAHGVMSAREAAAIGVDLCHALAAVHRVRLLHRDIKASNVRREEGGRIVLMDFGTGRSIPAPHEPVDPLAGTPLYLAPELLAGHKPSVVSDIYSLGVLLFHLVTGGYPVTGTDRSDVVRAHDEQRRTSLRDVRPDLPSAFVEAVECALSADPKQRYRTAGEFGATLASLAGVPYRPDPRPRPDWRIAASAAFAIALLAGAYQTSRISQEAETRATDVPLTIPSPPQPADQAAAAAYQVKAAFYAERNGATERLAAGSRVAPGDRLFLTLESSRPVFVYIVNQDEAGHSYLLFPLPGHEPGNPVPFGRTNRLPGVRSGETQYWQVTSAGGREHFFVYAAPDRLTEFEQMLAALPRAEAGRSVESVLLPAARTLRGVGGVTSSARAVGGATTPELMALEPLSPETEAATGVWARRITFDNPVR